MNQILDLIQLYKTGSVLSGTTTPGTSSIFTSGSVPDLYFKNTAGTIYKLSDTGSYINILEYTSSGQYKMAPNVKHLQILAIGAGGGGGSGRSTTNVTNRSGGAGGSGGALVVGLFPSASFTSQICNIVVGPGGRGGFPVATNAGNGAGGLTGTATSMTISGSPATTIIIANAGPGGGGGTTTANNGGVATGITWQGIGRPWVWNGQNGRATNVNGATDAFGYAGACPAGGRGGYINSANTYEGPYSSSTPWVYGVLTSTGSPSPNESGGTGSNGAALFPPAVHLNISGSFLNETLTYALGNGLGSAGHGGGTGNITSPGIPGGRGGNGITYGAGGGGGGASCSASSGGGGRGGPGYMLIIEYI